MRIAYFDCRYGAAGDMLLASLLGAGLDERTWRNEMDKLSLPAGSYEAKVSRATRSSISATRLEVSARGDQPERHLSDVAQIISSSRIPQPAADLAVAVFERLAQAEAAVHGTTREEVHFHEVGAVDAIVDIVGFAVAYHQLGIKRSVVSPVPLGAGMVETEHGLFPAPGPAVLELLRQAEAPVAESEIDFECLTPTGAAILATIAFSWGPPPSMSKILSTGYGAGARDPAGWPNVCRVIIGHADPWHELEGTERFASEDICVVEANIDDFPAQSLAYVTEQLRARGALDVAVLPAVMKKGRSGHVISLLCRPEDAPALEEMILDETSTIGVRCLPAKRLVARREWVEVKLKWGNTVRIKVARDRAGKLVNAQPEFEDCAATAAAAAVPLKEVLAEAAVCFRRLENGATTADD